MSRLTAIGVLALILVLPGAMNTAGFCWRDGRFPSDAELITAFADDLAELHRGARWEAILRGRTGDRTLRVAKLAEYADGSALLAANPNCCVVGRLREGVSNPLPNPGFRDRVTGYANQIVTSTIWVIYLDAAGEIRKHRSAGHSWTDSCGRIKRPRF